MSYVIRQIHPPGKSALAHEADLLSLTMAAVQDEVVYGKYLQWSDPDARHGFGDERWTDDLAKAQRFATFQDAMDTWKAPSLTRPIRPDGKVNRPMTAFSITVEKIKD